MQAIRGHQAEPFRIISMDCDGNLSTFSPELLGVEHECYGSLSFGNLLDHSFEDFEKGVLSSKLYADIKAGVEKCAATCDYFGVCGGGAPANKIFENGSAATTETNFCRMLMRSIDVTLKLIEQLPANPTREWITHQTQTAPLQTT